MSDAWLRMSSRVVEILTIPPRSVNTRTPEHPNARFVIAIRKGKEQVITSRAKDHVEIIRHTSFCCLQSKKSILNFSLVTRLCTFPRFHSPSTLFVP